MYKSVVQIAILFALVCVCVCVCLLLICSRLLDLLFFFFHIYTMRCAFFFFTLDISFHLPCCLLDHNDHHNSNKKEKENTPLFEAIPLGLFVCSSEN